MDHEWTWYLKALPNEKNPVSDVIVSEGNKDFVVVNVGLDVQYLVLEPGRSSFGFEASHVLAITFVSPEREWRQVR